jgi:hypothetical protein
MKRSYMKGVRGWTSCRAAFALNSLIRHLNSVKSNFSCAYVVSSISATFHAAVKWRRPPQQRRGSPICAVGELKRGRAAIRRVIQGCSARAPDACYCAAAGVCHARPVACPRRADVTPRPAPPALLNLRNNQCRYDAHRGRARGDPVPHAQERLQGSALGAAAGQRVRRHHHEPGGADRTARWLHARRQRLQPTRRPRLRHPCTRVLCPHSRT